MTDTSILSAGYVLTPHIGAKVIEFPVSQTDASWPTIIGSIPNLEEFSSGPDITGSAFIAKRSGWDMCVVPAEYKAFLPTLQVALDQQYAEGNATEQTILIRASRHTASIGEPHQNHIPDWHDHKAEGRVKIYSAADVLGTDFKVTKSAMTVPKAKSAAEFDANLEQYQASAAPPGNISRFNEDTFHCTPKPGEEAERRRTFFVAIAYEKGLPPHKLGLKAVAEMANPIEAYISPTKPNRTEVLQQWQQNAAHYFGNTPQNEAGILVLLDTVTATHVIEEIQMDERSKIPAVRSIVDHQLGLVLPAVPKPMDPTQACSLRIKTNNALRTMHVLNQTPGVKFAAYIPR